MPRRTRKPTYGAGYTDVPKVYKEQPGLFKRPEGVSDEEWRRMCRERVEGFHKQDPNRYGKPNGSPEQG